jgi:hypothetical protein
VIENPFKGMSRTSVYASLAGFTGITGYLVVRHHKSTGTWNPWSGAGSQGTTSTTAIDPVTGMPVSQDDAVDPLTNMTYLAEAQQYGSVQAAEASVSQFGTSAATGSGVGVQPASGYPVAGSPSGTQSGTPYTSNQTWAQAAQAGLTDIGFDPEAIAAALGAYLQQEPLTPDQVKIVEAARAEYGPPPVGNLQIIPAPASGPAAPKPPMTPVLSVTPHPGSADFGWNQVTGAAGYELVVTGAGGKGTGTSHFDQPVTGTHVEKLSLQPGHYVAYVRARNATGASPYSPHKPFAVTR